MLAKAIHSADEKEQLAACSRLRRLLSVIGEQGTLQLGLMCMCGRVWGALTSLLVSYWSCRDTIVIRTMVIILLC